MKITHRGLAYKIWVSNMIMAHQAEDVIFADYPIFHVAGFYNRCASAIADGMCIVIPTALGARNKEFIARYWKFVERCGVTVLAGVPTTLSVLAKNPPQGENVSSLRPYMPTGSTGMPIEVAHEIERITGVRCLLTYGATEYTANVTQVAARRRSALRLRRHPHSLYPAPLREARRARRHRAQLCHGRDRHGDHQRARG